VGTYPAMDLKVRWIVINLLSNNLKVNYGIEKGWRNSMQSDCLGNPNPGSALQVKGIFGSSSEIGVLFGVDFIPCVLIPLSLEVNYGGALLETGRSTLVLSSSVKTTLVSIFLSTQCNFSQFQLGIWKRMKNRDRFECLDEEMEINEVE
jgi:hypothetical protein